MNKSNRLHEVILKSLNVMTSDPLPWTQEEIAWKIARDILDAGIFVPVAGDEEDWSITVHAHRDQSTVEISDPQSFKTLAETPCSSLLGDHHHFVTRTAYISLEIVEVCRCHISCSGCGLSIQLCGQIALEHANKYPTGKSHTPIKSEPTQRGNEFL